MVPIAFGYVSVVFCVVVLATFRFGLMSSVWACLCYVGSGLICEVSFVN